MRFVPTEVPPPTSEFTPRFQAQQITPPWRPASLYLHVPFCFHKCHYCDFYSVADRGGAQGDKQVPFTEALLRELDGWAARATLRPRTLFVGGGTPTLLRPELWRRLLAAMAGLGVLDDAVEFTVEANPETLTPGLAGVLKRGGVNRLSIGAQSFHPRLLQALERWHEPASVGRAVAIARDAGIDDVNLDLIFAIPGASLDDWRRDLDAAIALGPTHLSCYGLTYEPNTTLGVKLRLGRVSAVGEDLELAMYEHALDALAAAGFEHYETSNWARAGRRCGHNLAYWNRLDYLGLGPSAASHRAGRRWKNEPHLGRYRGGVPDPPRAEDEALTPEQRGDEALLLGLRLREGVPLADLDAIAPAGSPRAEAIGRMTADGYLERTATRLRLTRKGLPVADGVIATIV